MTFEDIGTGSLYMKVTLVHTRAIHSQNLIWPKKSRSTKYTIMRVLKCDLVMYSVELQENLCVDVAINTESARLGVLCFHQGGNLP